jgi:transcriptional regulator with XRE-family HTH domain
MAASDDDERLGQLFRLLREELQLTQEELAIATSIPVVDIHRLENGRVGEVAYGRARRLFAEFDARARISVWWKGAAADRLLDERHAAYVERSARVLRRDGWGVPSEVTYSEYGERGSIDLFGHRREFEAVAVGEVKSAFGSLEELNRSLDVKVRLAPTICRKRFGWTPKHVGRLIVPGLSSTRRVVAAHRQTMDELYPARAREIRGWVHRPVGNIGGIWFLSNPRNARTDVGPPP